MTPLFSLRVLPISSILMLTAGILAQYAYYDDAVLALLMIIAINMWFIGTRLLAKP